MSHAQPLIGIAMGSRSDLPTLIPGIKVLRDFDVPYEVRIVSAHRTPSRMSDFATQARERGLRAIIAAAGGSAHLPGMIASETTLPVVGVAVEATPARTEAAVGSQIYMPAGKPLAFLGSGEPGAVNAALFVVRILALGDDRLAAAYARYDEELAERVVATDEELEQYLSDLE